MDIKIKKNEEYIVDIIDNGFSGEGIAKIDGFTVFVPNLLKGETAKIRIVKVVSSHAFGKVIEILNEDEARREVDCETFYKCGGCSLRFVDYNKTLEIKREAVKSTFKKNYGKEIEIDEVIGMSNPYNYRNKLQYPIGIDSNGKPVMGVFRERTHEIIETSCCRIQNREAEEVALFIYDFVKKNNIHVYDEKKLKGSLRHVIVRIGIKTDEIMVTLVSNEEKIEKEDELVKEVVKNFPKVKVIVKNINNKNTNVILGRKNITLYGEGHIYDYIGEFKFKISPMSFYQVNPIQTEKLYSKAVEYAELTGIETVYDLYCGIGTIGIFASKKVKKLYGIETVPEAIEDAKYNAKLNKIKNAEFFVGDVENVLPEFIKTTDELPDVIFIDPPRKGCDKTAIETILKIKPKKLVYVSCNPATLARDVKLLEEKYDLGKITLVDMFPFTHHVECVVAMILKESL